MRNLRVLAAAILLIFATGFEAYSQDQSAAVSEPFVSRLKAEASGPQIKLTWEDSPDMKGQYLVYRHTDPITLRNIDSAKLLGQVPTGVQYYLDTPGDLRGYYYAIILQDSSGKLYKILIDFRNKTNAAVAVTSTATEEELASRITGIKAAVSADGGSIEVSFASSNPQRDLLVFWNTSPMATSEDLLQGASKVSIDPGVTTYKVPGIPGVDYYFAVLDAGLYKLGKNPLKGGENTTSSPVMIPLTRSVAQSFSSPQRRALPLPSLDITKAVDSGKVLPSDEPYALPEEKTVSADTAKAISEILSGIHPKPPAEPTPAILESDTTPAAGGELASLQSVVRNQFAGGKLDDAKRLIQDFLSLPRSADVEARAYFYLGEIACLQGHTREAILSFIMAQEYFYPETRPWLDICFLKLEAGE
jgi:hypothetical protein